MNKEKYIPRAKRPSQDGKIKLSAHFHKQLSSHLEDYGLRDAFIDSWVTPKSLKKIIETGEVHPRTLRRIKNKLDIKPTGKEARTVMTSRKKALERIRALPVNAVS